MPGTQPSELLEIPAQAIGDQEAAFRLVHRRLRGERRIQERAEAAQTPVPARLLPESVNLLEVAWFCAVLAEVVVADQIATFGEFLAQAPRISGVAARITGLTDERLLEGSTGRRLVELARRVKPDPARPLARSLERALGWSQSLVALCPLEWIEQLSREQGRPDLGHRCRLAWDGLQAFVRRNEAGADASRRIVGRAYQEGRLSLPEAAALLGAEPPDAVAYLESHGYARSVDASAAPDPAALERIDADRRARGGSLDLVERAIDREVIASQRIEGIDARPWLGGYPCGANRSRSSGSA